VQWKAVLDSIWPNNDHPDLSSLADHMEKVVGKLGYRELDKKGREERDRKKASTERLVMAMFGGISLIAPMLIMTLHPSTTVNLVTVSAATFFFAIALAIGAKESSGKDVLAATAAYAAVLVVFVGTSTSAS